MQPNLPVFPSINAKEQDISLACSSLEEESFIHSDSSDQRAVELFFNSLPLSSVGPGATQNVSLLDKLDDGSFDSSFLCSLIQEEAAAPSRRQIEKQPLSTARLAFHKDYLIKRIKEMDFQYGAASALFEEIKVKGYRGSCDRVYSFVKEIRKKRRALSPEIHLDFHKDYLIKRIQNSYPLCVPAPTVFAEITAKGYRGSLRAVKLLLTTLRREIRPLYPEAHLHSHKSYLRKRIEEAHPRHLPASVLFKEIKDRGYRGSLKTLKMALTTLRKDIRPLCPESHLRYHKSYLRKRVEEMYPSRLSASILFQEIKGKGYQGSLKTLQGFLTAILKERRSFPLPEAHLDFHEDYLIKRVGEMPSPCRSPDILFEEIKSKGYGGSIEEVHRFLATGYNKRTSVAANLEFHKEYLIERVRKNPHSPPKASTLFKEIQSKGYKKSFSNMRHFLLMVYDKHAPSTASLNFHKKYLTERVQQNPHSPPEASTLFKEIQSRGYKRSFRSMQMFLETIPNQISPYPSSVRTI